MTQQDTQIGIIGLGYVGLPLALAFAQHTRTLGFDINPERIRQLQQGIDSTGEASSDAMSAAKHLRLSSTDEGLADCNVIIITVPTPVDEANQPDFAPLIAASQTAARHLKSGDIVVYESTVYPGTTEEICVPVLEQVSGLQANVDFFYGYSPERINPGDTQRGLADIVKVTSGSTDATAQRIDALYQQIIHAGTYRASSIKVAEAAKVIENTQRDVNIALINELAMMFNAMHIDTQEVLAAARTKWNFLPFQPGLVGGHCIGVDPYYLSHKATALGYHPEMILAARRINSRMGLYVAHELMRLMASQRQHIVDARILVLGLAFKENCGDLRNTRVVDIVKELQQANARVDVHDPYVNPQQAQDMLGFPLTKTLTDNHYDAVVAAVPHHAFLPEGGQSPAWMRAVKPSAVVYDVKAMVDKSLATARL